VRGAQLVRSLPFDRAAKIARCWRSLMKDADGYLNEIRENLKKIQAQGKVTPTENALFGMIDGLAGLQMATLERMADLNRRLQALESGSR